MVTTMKRLGEDRGCGRALWENNNDEDKYGTPMALMLLPFWTDGCIALAGGFVLRGLRHDAVPLPERRGPESSTAPTRCAASPTRTATSPRVSSTCRRSASATTSPTAPRSSPRPISNPTSRKVATSGPWSIYEVRGSDLVVPLTDPTRRGPGRQQRPRLLARARHVVVPEPERLGRDARRRRTEGVAADRPEAGEREAHRLAQPGRRSRRPRPIQPQPLPPVTVSDVVQGDDSHLLPRRPGRRAGPGAGELLPELEALGATGPYRVAPNLMVVIPTKNDVSLHYGWTGVDMGCLRPDRSRAGRCRGAVAGPAYRSSDGDGPTGQSSAPSPSPATTLFMDWDDNENVARGRSRRRPAPPSPPALEQPIG